MFRFPGLPSLLSVTEDENTLITGATVAQLQLSHDPPVSCICLVSSAFFTNRTWSNFDLVQYP